METPNKSSFQSMEGISDVANEGQPPTQQQVADSLAAPNNLTSLPSTHSANVPSEPFNTSYKEVPTEKSNKMDSSLGRKGSVGKAAGAATAATAAAASTPGGAPKWTIGTYKDRGFWVTFFDQLWIMVKRNFILQKRYYRSTLAQAFGAPFIFFLLLFILQRADYARQTKGIENPLSYPLPGVASCERSETNDPCISIMYTPDTAATRSILTLFNLKNEERTGESLALESAITTLSTKPTTRDLGMVPVPSSQFIYDYTFTNRNVTLYGIVFDTTQANNYKYQVWYNNSLLTNETDIFSRQVLSVMRGLDEAIITYLNDPAATRPVASLDTQLKDWPVIPPTVLQDTIISQSGPVFFFCASMVVFFQVLNGIAGEKESKLRRAMQTMGLTNMAYWLSWFIAYGALVVVNSLVCTVMGYIFQFRAFLNTNFFIIFTTYLLFGLSIVTLAFFLSTFVRTVRSAVLVGIFVFIIGLIFESFIFSSSFIGYIWWDANSIPIFVAKIFSALIPFFNFGRSFLDITTLTNGSLDFLTETFVPGPGFDLASLYKTIKEIDPTLLPTTSSAKPDPWAANVTWAYFLLNILIFSLGTWFFDNVIADEFGNKKPLWFFLMPSYWGVKTWTLTNDLSGWLKITREKSQDDGSDITDEDPDVSKERTRSVDESVSAPLRIVNLRKVYRQSSLWKSSLDKIAVKSLCLALPEGKCLALLGQNGAGKSTSMNILSGLSPATSGDAFIYGYSVANQMDEIQKIMGVCPQHDVLFDDLTAKEHFELYGGLKGLTPAEIQVLVDERLKAVRLYKVRDQRAGTYSGGMKRRLSMMIATIGDPKVVILDEPTTGMDPVNRRYVWSFIEKFKKERIIILTTHSMEEADVLGDRVAIMAHGRLRALNTSVNLKSRFGEGYRVNVLTHSLDQVEQVKQGITKFIPDAKLEDESAGALIYQLPRAAKPVVPKLVEWMELQTEKVVVKAWGISQTTLEEVFLKLIREANPMGYGN